MIIETLDELKEASIQHFKEDVNFQQEFREFMRRAEPMLVAFEKKKIVRMAIEEETGTIIIWVKRIGVVTAFLLACGTVIKYIINLFLIKNI